MSGKPVGLQLSATDTVQRYHGHPVKVTVHSIGTDTVNVFTRTVMLHTKCRETPAHGITVSPASFTLTPGESRTVTVTIPSSHGDYGVVFEASSRTAHGQVAGTGIGAQILNGASSCVRPVQHVTAPRNTQTVMAGFPLTWTVLIILGVILAVWAMLLRRKARRLHN